MRAFLSLILAVSVLAASPALARGHYSRAHTKKLVRMRQYPKHGKAAVAAAGKHRAAKH